MKAWRDPSRKQLSRPQVTYLSGEESDGRNAIASAIYADGLGCTIFGLPGGRMLRTKGDVRMEEQARAERVSLWNIEYRAGSALPYCRVDYRDVLSGILDSGPSVAP